jgi:hypothetical protein
MRLAQLVLLSVVIVGCTSHPEAPEQETIEVDPIAQRAAEIEQMLTLVVEATEEYKVACYPGRVIIDFDLRDLAQMSIDTAQLETQGWDMSCVSYGYDGDSYGAVHPQSGMVFQCDISQGLVITMRRGSLADGTAECTVVQSQF